MLSSLFPSPTINQKAARVSAWLESEQSVAPDQLHDEQRKRRRDSNSDSDHSHNMPRQTLKRRKENDDDIAPDQSMLHAVNVLELNDRTTLTSLVTGSKRSTSPIRQKTLLRDARPPIRQDSLANPSLQVPVDVAPRLSALRQRLGRGLRSRFIPACLRPMLESEPAFHNSLSNEPIDDDAYDDVAYDKSDEQLTQQSALIIDQAKVIIHLAKAVLKGTDLCIIHNKDENAWCLDVVVPLLNLALVLYGRENFRCESVQSQSIQPAYVPRTKGPTASTEIFITRKTDFCFSYSHLHPKYAALYSRLEHANISHTTDNYTESAALFSGIEVKPPNGGDVEAQVQVCVWMSASLRKKAALAALAQEAMRSKPDIPSVDEAIDVASANTRATSASDRLPDLSALIEPAVTITGPHHKVYYAFISTPIDADNPDTGGIVSVLGSDTRLPQLTTETVQGVFQLARLYGNILEYGMDEGREGFWGPFLGPVLGRIAHALEVERG